MNKLILFSICYLLIVSCEQAPKHKSHDADKDLDVIKMEVDCADPWIVHHNTPNEMVDSIVNDSLTQIYLDGKLWFEILNSRDFDSTYKIAQLKYYRTNGTLQEEGPGIYQEHPAKNYLDHGTWVYYDCKEIERERLTYNMGDFVGD